MHRLDPGELVDLETELLAPGPAHLRTVMVSSVDGAATLDGRVGALTGPADQRLLHAARCVSDVVLVGAGTIRAEGYGPLLAAPEESARRVARGQTPHPGLAIVTSSGDLDLTHPLFTEARTRPVVLVPRSCPRLAALAEVAEVLTAGEDVLDLVEAVGRLRASGRGRIGCEGGARLNETLLAADLVDELVLTTSPRLVGGDAPRIVQGPGLRPPRPARLLQALTEDGYLFTRWSLR
ncbi:pyrimidine reductase family protein [Auraticoccus sp. F435]|uniref:Pyrimidine reductase family protein n=1 Tax=Auraticoccus cholistanensis TaxID=2656650 RepID=A0A6A9URG5_9ACTN|nr:dihydrofolate reductase family protein [Auraticoccus cholistanensis]MVA75158.1 pyrimidine reductase family protein [Auraticoccus cholistanensis]